MNIIIKSNNFEVTQAIKQYAEQKLEAAYGHLSKNTTSSLEVDLGMTSKHHKHGEMFSAKALLVMGSKRIHLEAVTDDMYKSIDELKDKLTDEIAHTGDRKRSIMRNIARRFKSLIKRS